MASKHTTLRLNTAIMRKAKAYARSHDLTLTMVMERALSAYLGSPRHVGARQSPKLPAFGKGGPKPNVDLDDTSALLDVMDGIE